MLKTNWGWNSSKVGKNRMRLFPNLTSDFVVFVGLWGRPRATSGSSLSGVCCWWSPWLQVWDAKVSRRRLNWHTSVYLSQHVKSKTIHLYITRTLIDRRTLTKAVKYIWPLRYNPRDYFIPLFYLLTCRSCLFKVHLNETLLMTDCALRSSTCCSPGLKTNAKGEKKSWV